MKILRWPLNIASILIFLAGVTCLTYSPVRNSLKQFFLFEKRTVLATVDADTGIGPQYKIIKLKNHTGILLEIYDASQLSMPLLDSLSLGQGSDTFFTYNGKTSNLFIDYKEGDSSLEILVPSLDQDMVAHLTPIRFDPATKRLFQYNQ